MTHYSEKHYAPNNDFDRFYYSLFFKKGNKILDIGCSTGNFLAQDSSNIVGVDIDVDAVNIAKKRGFKAILQKDPKKLPFKNKTFDNVHCRHVLEHLTDPSDFMKEIFRILKKSGRLVLLTDKYSEHFWDDYTHIRPYTKKSLDQLAYDAGFRKYKIYDFPLGGVFGLGSLKKYNLISSILAKRVYLFYAKLLEGNGLLIEAIK